MIQLGYTLSSEEHAARDLIRRAGRAEEAGFSLATISDHFHPWSDAQGESPFVWGVLGGVAQVTQRLRVGTAVTCPLIRVHPAVVAQAAATAASLLEGRFFLGVGTGELLNEHITGQPWPPASVRREMLEEAVGLMRQLWQGGSQSHRGSHFTVDRARIYSLPGTPPEVLVAAAGEASSELAGRVGDGLIAVAPQASTVEAFRLADGAGKPCLGQPHVCWAPSVATARQVAHAIWPNAALPGQLSQELAVPSLLEQACQAYSAEDVAASVVCGPDPEAHVAAIRRFEDAGFTHLTVHQVGPDQEGVLRFYEREILPLASPPAAGPGWRG
jgi:coenzyme F420-dependent glucose-6-phosphate dehydrogenase